MNAITRSSSSLLLLSAIAVAAPASLAAQTQDPPEADLVANISGAPEPELVAGPEIEGIISARSGNRVQVATTDGSTAVFTVNEATRIKSSGGFLGMNSSKVGPEALLNGLPVTVKTWQAGSGLVANQISVKNKDVRTAAMIYNGTDQRFAEQTAATEALRGRMGDIDQYNVKHTTNVNFDTGKAQLSAQAKSDLCATAAAAEGMDNALLLVVGYTDSTGSQEFNQTLSEKRAGSVVNYLQQQCGWKPYRMLTPTGMAEADPLADNESYQGKAQNRRVAVNVLVSKAVDGL